MMTHIYIRGGLLHRWTLSEVDLTALPGDASLVCIEDWERLCELAGGEEKLMAEMGVKEAEGVWQE